jgi:hypothetical protein
MSNDLVRGRVFSDGIDLLPGYRVFHRLSEYLTRGLLDNFWNWAVVSSTTSCVIPRAANDVLPSTLSWGTPLNS